MLTFPITIDLRHPWGYYLIVKVDGEEAVLPFEIVYETEQSGYVRCRAPSIDCPDGLCVYRQVGAIDLYLLEEDRERLGAECYLMVLSKPPLCLVTSHAQRIAMEMPRGDQ